LYLVHKPQLARWLPHWVVGFCRKMRWLLTLAALSMAIGHPTIVRLIRNGHAYQSQLPGNCFSRKRERERERSTC